MAKVKLRIRNGKILPGFMLDYRGTHGRVVVDAREPLTGRLILNKRRAEQLLLEKLSEVAAAKANPMLQRGSGERPLADFVEQHLTTHVAKLKDRRHPRARLLAFGEYMGRGARLCDVTVERVEHYLAERREGKRGRAGRGGATLNANTLTRELRAITGLMEHAFRLDLIPFNPLRRIKAPTSEAAQTRAATPDEVDALLWHAQEDPNPTIAPFIELALATGGRASEINNLAWSDVVTEPDPYVEFRHTKSGAARVVPIVADAAKVLQRMRGPGAAGRVFAINGRPLSGPPWAALRRVAKAAGVEWVGFHTFRRTYATRLHEAGATLSEIQRLLGHSTPQVTALYIKTSERSLRASVERAGAFWKGIRPAARSRKQRGSKR